MSDREALCELDSWSDHRQEQRFTRPQFTSTGSNHGSTNGVVAGLSTRVALKSIAVWSIAVTGLLASYSPAAADASPSMYRPFPAATDTVPVPRGRLLEGRLLFTPSYLGRVVAAAASRTAAALRFGKPLPTRVGELASVYAGKYGIDPQLARQIVEIAEAEGIDPELGFRLVQVESRFVPAARGPGGSLGLTQLMPETARGLDRSVRSETQMLDPATNLRLGFRYLRSMIERYDGDVRLGLLAYNRGLGTVDAAIRRGRNPENGYTSKVLGSGAGSYAGSPLTE